MPWSYASFAANSYILNFSHCMSICLSNYFHYLIWPHSNFEMKYKYIIRAFVCIIGQKNKEYDSNIRLKSDSG